MMDCLVLNEYGPDAWERFLNRRSQPNDQRLVERWERARKLGVDPEQNGQIESIITDSQLNQRRKELDRLLAVSVGILESTAPAFSDRDFLLLIADRDGVVLQTFGGGQFRTHAKSLCLVEGAEWREEVHGTNAIGTALVEERPVIIGGYAHYERRNHDLICYGCPIRNPVGEVAAVLDATSYSRQIDPLAKVAICSAARAIEETWRNAVLFGIGHGPDQIMRELESRDGPAFMVVPGGAITEYNGAGRALLKGRPPNIQQTLDTRWSQIQAAISSGSDALTLAASAGVRDDSIDLKLEPFFDGDRLVGSVVELRERVRRTARHAGGGASASRPAPETSAFDDLFGDDRKLARSRDVAARFAASSLPVLLLAETGTGKDLMARAIHRASDRRDAPFIAVNCGGLTPSLLESELFGYGPGAFTGASPDGRMGRISAAHTGTLFLDEVGEMPASLQTSLLRVLEDGSYNRVGEYETRQCDIRLICATCRDLPAMVEEGAFRKDLYYRVRGACVTLPPLREREDIVELAEFLLEQCCEELDVAVPRITTDAVRWLRDYDWPGNVRELKNAVHHAVILANDADELRREHFPHADSATAFESNNETSGGSIHDAERRALVHAREASDGNITEMARRLGVARTTVYRMLERHGLD